MQVFGQTKKFLPQKLHCDCGLDYHILLWFYRSYFPQYAQGKTNKPNLSKAGMAFCV